MKNCILMYGERQVATIRADGSCFVHLPRFMPFNLRLKETDDDENAQTENLNRFYYWCATRPLTLKRASARDFLFSHGLLQASTDAERAEITLACHGMCLMDVFWLRKPEDTESFDRINLFDQPLSGEYTDVVLRDRGMIEKNTGLVLCADSEGVPTAWSDTPNVWIRQDGDIWLLKAGLPAEVEAELVASRIVRCFDVEQVLYEPAERQGRQVSRCRLITTKERGIISAGDALEYLARTGTSMGELLGGSNEYGYHMMNIIDYLIGNTDRNLRNWGFWVDHDEHVPGRLYPLMDFNRSFRSYESLEGDMCFTMKGRTQKDAAIRGVQAVGLNQIRKLPEDLPALFSKLNELSGMRFDIMFRKRLDVLRQSICR